MTDEERYQEEEYNPEGFRFFMAIMASIGMLTMLALGVYALYLFFCAITWL